MPSEENLYEAPEEKIPFSSSSADACKEEWIPPLLLSLDGAHAETAQFTTNDEINFGLAS